MSARVKNDPSPLRRGEGTRSPARKTAVVAILLMAVAVLVFIAQLTYDGSDEAIDVHASDLFRSMTGDMVAKAKADVARNGLGLTGVIITQFLFKSTMGYSTLAFPVLMFLWGWTTLRKGDLHRLLVATNYTLIGVLLLSTAFGMARLLFAPGGPAMEWSGVVGDYFALVLSQLVGKAGASVVLLAALLITLVLAVDLDLHLTIDRIRSAFLRLLDWSARRREERREKRQLILEARERERRAAEVKISRPPLEEPLPKPRPVPVVNRPATPPEPEKLERPAAGVPLTIIPTPKEEQQEEVPAEEPGGATGEIDYVPPTVELLDPPRTDKEAVDEGELKANADLLRATLAEFDVELESVSVTPGPVVTLYELVPATGVKISRIVSLENDMAMKLAARGIRIMAPIPGKSAVGVEIPNSHRSLVTIRSVINSEAFRRSNANLPLALGKTIAGEVFTDDLSRMPHLLIAGSTGSGKSVGINTILTSLLFRLHPSDLKLVIVDPKKIELAQYAKLKHHFLAISPDADEEILTTPHSAVTALRSVEYEMEKRYDRLAAAGVRNIVDYNEKVRGGKLKDAGEVRHITMPFLIVVIDELADLMITAAREVEEPIARLAQLARAVGIHLIVATQRPSVDVITGVIKANFPARIAYQVASKIDSRTILDMNGAEQLLGNGDMLYLASGSPKPVRLQNAYVSPDEVDAVMAHIGSQKGYPTPYMLPSIMEKKKSAGSEGSGGNDDLFEEAARLIVRHQQGSVSLLQRRLKVGYSRAARLVDELEAAGIVGPFDGSKAREVLVESEAELDVILHGS